MHYKNRSFPGWVGPILGPIGGAGAAFRLLYREGFPNDVNSWVVIGVGAGGGLVAGLIVWALDWHWRRHERAVAARLANLPPGGYGREARPGGPSSSSASTVP
jgi:hypothetical protein